VATDAVAVWLTFVPISVLVGDMETIISQDEGKINTVIGAKKEKYVWRGCLKYL